MKSNNWDDYIPAPIEVFHGETMKSFHAGAHPNALSEQKKASKAEALETTLDCLQK